MKRCRTIAAAGHAKLAPISLVVMLWSASAHSALTLAYVDPPYVRALIEAQRALADQRVLTELSRFACDPSREPSPLAKTAFVRLQPVVRSVLSSSRRQDVSFDARDAERPGVRPEELQWLSMILLYESYRAAYAGEREDAVASVCGLFRMSRQVAACRDAGEGFAVSVSLHRIADQQSAMLLDYGLVDVAGARELLAAMGGESRDDAPDDPFGVRRQVRGMCNDTVAWSRTLTGDAGVAKLKGEYAGVAVTSGFRAFLDDLNADSLRGAIDGLARCAAELARVEGTPIADWRSRLAAIERDVADGRHGPLARNMMERVFQVVRQADEQERARSSRLALLRDIIDGTVDPASLASAAVSYMRAARTLDDLSTAGWRDIEVIEFDGTPASDEMIALLLAAQPMLDLAERASKMTRCDFGLFRGRFGLFAPYHFDVAALARLVRADLRRAIAAGEPALAQRRAATLIRLCRQLGSDPSLLSCALASSLLEDVAADVRAMLQRRLLSDAALRDLRCAIEPLDRASGLAFDAAIERSRSELVQWIAQDDRNDPGMMQEARRVIAECDAERLVLLMLARDMDWDRLNGGGEVADAAARLGSAMFFPGMALALPMLPAVQACVQNREPAVALLVEIAPILEIVRRSRQTPILVHQLATEVGEALARIAAESARP